MHISEGKGLLEEYDEEAPCVSTHVTSMSENKIYGENPPLPSPVWTPAEQSKIKETFALDRKELTSYFVAKDMYSLTALGVLTCTWACTPCYLACATKNGKARADALHVALTPDEILYVTKKKTKPITGCWNWRDNEVTKVSIPLENVEKVVTIPRTGKGCFVKSTLDKVVIYEKQKPKGQFTFVLRGLTEAKMFEERVNAMMYLNGKKKVPKQLTM